MSITSLIVGAWAFLMIIALCFKDSRKRFSDAQVILIPKWKVVCNKYESKYGVFMACLLMLFATLIFLVRYFLFLSLFPLFSVYGILATFRGNVVINARLQELQQRENEYKQKRALFKSFYYEGIAPFDFDDDTYIYVESSYDVNLNQCIEKNLDKVEEIFSSYGFRFLYLPKWKPDASLICRANLSDSVVTKVNAFLSSISTVEYTRLLCKALRINIVELESGVFHFAGFVRNEYDIGQIKSTMFTLFPMQGVTEDTLSDFCLEYCMLIKEGRERVGSNIHYMSVVSKLKGREYYENSGTPQQEIADYESPIVMKNIAENIKTEMEALKEAGYFELLLHTLGADMLDELRHVKLNPPLSRLEITDDFRIRLLDYDKEVRMTPLQKTLYIFYLRHPEGVEFKMLSAYYDELLAIYKVLSNRENDDKQRESIRRLVDVTDNAINEKCSRIKEAFLKVADDFIAKNYYIVLREYCYWEKGEKKCCFPQKLLKKIILSRDLVIYPEEIARIEILAPEEKKQTIVKELKEIHSRFYELRNSFYNNSYPKGKLLEEYTEFLNSNPKYYMAYHYRAILFTHVGMYYEAIADNQLLIDHNERICTAAVINKAEALFFLKEYKEALKVANHYFEVEDEPTAESYHIRAEIFNKLEAREEYIADMKEHIRLLKEEKGRRY